jgi:(2Fe-2S) ferredoxin
MVKLAEEQPVARLKERFELTGRFLRFESSKSGEAKRLLIECDDGQQRVKIAKTLRKALPALLQPGVPVTISGIRSRRQGSSEIRLKAKSIKPVSTASAFQTGHRKGSIAICSKKNCWKRGGKDLWETLEQTLIDRGLTDQIKLKRTGCLKNCKKCPCLVCLPDRAIHKRLKPDDAPAVLNQHFLKRAS